MVRLIGVEIPDQKKLLYALRYIYGVGLSRAKEIVKSACLDPGQRVHTLREEELNKLTTKVSEVESEVNKIADEAQKAKLKALLSELRFLISTYVEIIRLANVLASYNLETNKENFFKALIRKELAKIIN